MDVGAEQSETEKPSNADSDPLKSSEELFNDFYSEVTCNTMIGLCLGSFYIQNTRKALRF